MDPNHRTLITSPPSSPAATRTRSGSESTTSSVRFSPFPSPNPTLAPTRENGSNGVHVRAPSNSSSIPERNYPLPPSPKINVNAPPLSPAAPAESNVRVSEEVDSDRTPMRTQVSTPVHNANPASVPNKQLSATAAKFEPKSVGLTAPSKANDQQKQKPEAKTSDPEDAIQPPNVYINGLPAHFPEDQLYALTSPYGPVRSVRSFTRHVGDRASGYGFVLFESMSSAQRCIEGLKKYKNLHPSLSKQVHKIPGTAYFHAPSLTPSASGISLASEESTDSVNSIGDDSFKQKMARLADTTSTNLYIEGLPLSTDEPTLAALMSPHIIKSSRLFQTKLSDPPRIIAFVRLESRQAAEEVIERLHGRMVRGWNDPGSRISVRFADTSEQRELRRTERQHREGEQSPARLTIAQAALLNLHGGDLRRPSSSPSVRRHPAPLITTNLPPIPTSRSMSPLPSAPHFQSNLPSQFSSMPNLNARANLNGQEVLDLTFASGHSQIAKYEVIGSGGRNSPLATELSQQRLILQRKQQQLLEQQALLDEERRRLLAIRDQALLNDLRRNGSPFNAVANNAYNRHMLLNDDAIAALGPPAATRARNGYTPAEELLLLAHQSQRVSLFGAQSMSENDFHSGATFSSADFSQQTNDFSSNSSIQQPQSRHYLPKSSKSAVLAQQQQQSVNAPRHSQSQPPLPGLNVTPSNQAHLRSTTLPQQRTQPAAGPKHFQHSSMSISIPNQQRNGATNARQYQQSNNQNQHNASTPLLNESVPNTKSANLSTNKPNGYDSPLVSPALTYSSSSSRTPASLSPATPFFTSFPSGEGFGEQVQQNQKQTQVDENVSVVQVDSRD